MKIIKDFLIKKLLKGHLLATGFSVVCGNYAFNIIEGEMKNIYIGKKGNGLMVFNKLLTYNEMKDLIG